MSVREERGLDMLDTGDELFFEIVIVVPSISKGTPWFDALLLGTCVASRFSFAPSVTVTVPFIACGALCWFVEDRLFRRRITTLYFHFFGTMKIDVYGGKESRSAVDKRAVISCPERW